MGFNIAGLILKQKLDSKQDLENLLSNELEFLKEVDFEAATSSFRDENTIDVLGTENGTFVIIELGKLYDITNIKAEVIQFMISDLSDTYYFEKYNHGNLDRKYTLLYKKF